MQLHHSWHTPSHRVCKADTRPSIMQPVCTSPRHESAHTSEHSPQQLPLLVGLTGSIGMGKSTVAGFLRGQNVPVLCADDVVHTLYASGGAAVGPVAEAFPSAVVSSAVDRALLSKCVVGNDKAMKQLESIVHPLVEAERRKFVQQVWCACLV